MKTKTAKEILQEKIGHKAVFSFDGGIALGNDILNANELVEAMEAYHAQFRPEITDEQIEKAAKQEIEEWYGSGEKEMEMCFKMGATFVRDLLTPSEGWVSVEKERPEIGVIVNLVLKHQKQDVYSGFRANGGWYCFRIGEDSKQFIPNGIKEAQITHWKTLPAPPHPLTEKK